MPLVRDHHNHLSFALCIVSFFPFSLFFYFPLQLFRSVPSRSAVAANVVNLRVEEQQQRKSETEGQTYGRKKQKWKKKKKRKAKRGKKKKVGRTWRNFQRGQRNRWNPWKNGVCARFTISRSGRRAVERKERTRGLVWLQGGKSKRREPRQGLLRVCVCVCVCVRARNLCPTKAGDSYRSFVPFDIPRWNSVKYLTYRQREREREREPKGGL